MTIADYLDGFADGSLTATTAVKDVLARIEDSRDDNVITGLNKERALERAAGIDAARASGQPLGRLAGVPFVAKDNFLTFDAPTTASSNMLRGFQAPYQATVIERLEAEGAICVAKANLDAFAHGSSTENSDFGPTKNPHDPSRVPGGSSGGSAAAVALDLVPFALGTDTGGSVRLPASYCGVVGIKPTYGALSRYGVIAMASSTDTIGVLAHTAGDVQLVMEVMGGRDTRDATTLHDAIHFQSPRPNRLRIGIIKEFMGDGLDPDTRGVVLAKVEELKSLGHEVSEVSLPSVRLALPVYYVVVPAEISSNLARYDGIKYGHRANNAENLGDLYEKSRSQGFNDENKRRIMIGNYVLSSGYFDAYYQKAQTVRTKVINEFADAFDRVDVLVGPTAPGPAFKFGQKTADPLQMYLVDVMTVAASIVGLPALSVPSGTVQGGLPVGLQLIGEQRSDGQLLALAAQLEGKKEAGGAQ